MVKIYYVGQVGLTLIWPSREREYKILFNRLGERAGRTELQNILVKNEVRHMHTPPPLPTAPPHTTPHN